MSKQRERDGQRCYSRRSLCQVVHKSQRADQMAYQIRLTSNCELDEREREAEAIYTLQPTDRRNKRREPYNISLTDFKRGNKAAAEIQRTGIRNTTEWK